MKFGQNVNKLKLAGDFNLSELERYTGVSRRTLGRILANRRSKKGVYTPTAGTVEKIAFAMDASPDQVLKQRIDVAITSQ